jgi:dihydrofolate reductase
MIAAIDEQGGLGFNNQLLCHLPEDLKHFKKTTMGKPIIMGHKTFESIGKPLPGRLNIVLSRHNPIIEGVEIVSSLEQALIRAKDSSEIIIIGGGHLFSEAMPIASRLYITRIHHQFRADVFFPEIKQETWKCIDEEFFPRDTKNQYDMTFYTYIRFNK